MSQVNFSQPSLFRDRSAEQTRRWSRADQHFGVLAGLIFSGLCVWSRLPWSFGFLSLVLASRGLDAVRFCPLSMVSATYAF